MNGFYGYTQFLRWLIDVELNIKRLTNNEVSLVIIDKYMHGHIAALYVRLLTHVSHMAFNCQRRFAVLLRLRSRHSRKYAGRLAGPHHPASADGKPSNGEQLLTVDYFAN